MKGTKIKKLDMISDAFDENAYGLNQTDIVSVNTSLKALVKCELFFTMSEVIFTCVILLDVARQTHALDFIQYSSGVFSICKGKCGNSNGLRYNYYSTWKNLYNYICCNLVIVNY